METVLLALLIGFVIAVVVAYKIVTGVGRKVKGVFKGGSRRAGRSKLGWVVIRVALAFVGAVAWLLSNTLRPLVACFVILAVYRSVRAVQRFVGTSGSLWDALLFRELQEAMSKTWESFPTTTFLDQKGIEHLPATQGWHWVYDLEGEPFGISATLVSAFGSSLGKIDDLTAPAGDKDEQLAGTLNRHLELSKTLFASLFRDYLFRELSFAAVDVQTTLERIQQLDSDTTVRSGYGVITLMRTDPLWKHVPIPMPMYAEAWERVGLPIPLHLGVDRWGQEVSIKLGRIVIMAKSGWGKSILLDTILMQLVTLPADRVVIIVIDCKWGMHHAKWEPGIDWLVVHPDHATACLETVHGIMEGRAATMKRDGQEKLPEATPETPAIVVITDEAQELPKSGDMNKPLAMEYLTKINQKGRALGVHTITALQYGTAKEVPRGLTLNADLSIAGKLKDQSAARVAMGEIADKNFGPHIIPDIERNKGVFAMGNQDTGFGTYLRVYNTQPADKLVMVQWAVQNNPRRKWGWVPEIEAVEQIDLTQEESDALDRMCKALTIEPDSIDIRQLPSLLQSAKRRMKPADHTKITEQLQNLLAA